ncbi:MAG: TrkH family potassium uptake protein [Clostridia bacterium]|nr:TrkH family potassium uptake protein [Clostridia bacterium]
MNFKMLRYITGKLLLAEGGLMFIPLLTMLIYGEFGMLYSVLIPIGMLLVLGFLLSLRKPEGSALSAKDGFVVVGLSWVILSFFGCLPFVLSGLIPNLIDAYFETVSGFTTTGASVLFAEQYDMLWNPADAYIGMRGIFLWRSFTNWIGGMGVLVFVLAVMPQQDMKSSRLVHIMRAEMPGPKVDKIVATVRKTAAIMYGIYVGLTLAQVIFLLFGGMDLYEALCTSFATAGTGGFAIWSDSMVTFGGTVAHIEYCQWVVAVFMFMFSINFNLYYLILTGKALVALFSEELRWFTGITVAATALLTYNIYSAYGNLGDALRNAFFQVNTVISTSGFATADFNLWPNLSKTLLLVLMFIGACAGSTGGGVKVSRLVISVKSTWAEIRHMTNPRQIKKVMFEKKSVDGDTVRGVFAYMVAYILIFFISFLALAIADGQSIETSFSSVAACLNNVGPGLDAVGPSGNFAFYSPVSKIVLTLDMLLGRLELFPILLLFSPSTWKEK